MLKVLVIDHELSALKIIEETFRPIRIELQLLTSDSDSTSLRNIFINEHPDLVLLNLTHNSNMVFEMLKTVKGFYSEVIFISTQIQHALDAIRWRALDFVLTPSDASEIQRVLKNALIHILGKRYNNNGWKRPTPGKLVVPVRDGHKFIESNTIMYLKADSGYTNIIGVEGKPLLISKKLGWLEKNVLHSDFIRVHRSYIVNKLFISEVHRNGGGMVVLNGLYKLPVSPKYKPLLGQILANENGNPIL